MDHFWQDIPGFFSTNRNAGLIDHIITWFPHGGTWVELGSWMGRSAAYSVVELARQSKRADFYCVDSFHGGTEHAGWPELATLREDFYRYTAPIRDRVTMIEGRSNAASVFFRDESVHFCYVDAGHTYEDVMLDLKAWYPKIHRGCWFGGDDYTKGYKGLQQAIWDFFGPKNIKVSRMGRCWIIKKPWLG